MIEPLAGSLASMLGLDKQPRAARQAMGDRTTLRRIAGHIVSGGLGDPQQAMRHWLGRAEASGRDGKLRKPVAVFVTEFRERLDDRKIPWEAAG